jgi:Bacterial SH3 domain
VTANAKVLTPGLNLRDRPGMDSKIIDQLSPKDELMVLRPGDKWVKVWVERSGTAGWVYAKDIEIKHEQPDVEWPPLPKIEPSHFDWLFLGTIIVLGGILLWGVITYFQY